MYHSKWAMKSVHQSVRNNHTSRMSSLDLFAAAPVPPQHDELKLWLILNQSHLSYLKLLDYFDQASAALQATPPQWQQLGIDPKHLHRWQTWQQQSALVARLDAVLSRLQQGHVQLLYYRDIGYPKRLLELPDPPPFLWWQGGLDVLHQAQIAIVGTRHPSPSGRRHAECFAKILAEQGLWVVSGLAQGVDAAAHQGALHAGGGRTIAVLGHGLDYCYPSQHRALREQIVAEGGVVLSEFLPDTKPEQYFFPRRNRIVSGLSLGVLVVEAAAKSGSLITAQQAIEQGRQVFAIPSHIDNVQAKGCHQLIRDGATLVDEPMQLIEDLALPRRWHQQEQTMSAPIEVAIDLPEHLQLVLGQLDWTGQDVDQLMAQTHLDIATLSSHLMELELLGHVIQVGGRYQRCRL
jgi:DNA processing protein